ncbi:unnamed protein product, partial [Amoebophrya sp. A120]
EVEVSDHVTFQRCLAQPERLFGGTKDEQGAVENNAQEYYAYFCCDRGNKILVAKTPCDLFRSSADPSEWMNQRLGLTEVVVGSTQDYTGASGTSSATSAVQQKFRGGLLGYYGFENMHKVEPSLAKVLEEHKAKRSTAESARAANKEAERPTTILCQYDSFLELDVAGKRIKMCATVKVNHSKELEQQLIVRRGQGSSSTGEVSDNGSGAIFDVKQFVDSYAAAVTRLDELEKDVKELLLAGSTTTASGGSSAHPAP